MLFGDKLFRRIHNNLIQHDYVKEINTKSYNNGFYKFREPLPNEVYIFKCNDSKEQFRYTPRYLYIDKHGLKVYCRLISNFPQKKYKLHQEEFFTLVPFDIELSPYGKLLKTDYHNHGRVEGIRPNAWENMANRTIKQNQRKTKKEITLDEHRIAIEIRGPQEAQADINAFTEKFSRHSGMCIDKTLKFRINNDCHEFELYLKENYPDEDCYCRIKNIMGFHEDNWTIETIKKYHKKYCPDYHKDQEEYSLLEVNNMLFDLKLEDVLLGYEQVTSPYVFDTETVFEGSVEVLRRYFI